MTIATLLFSAIYVRLMPRNTNYCWQLALAQNIGGILPVATLSIALYVLRRFMSARGGKFVIGFINTNKYTYAS